jgi:hypothetical protein
MPPSAVALLLLLLLQQASLPRAAEWRTPQVSGLVPRALAAGTATVPHSRHLLVTVGGLSSTGTANTENTVLLFDANAGTMTQITPSMQNATDALPPNGLYGSGYGLAGDDLVIASGRSVNGMMPGLWSLDLSGPAPFAWKPRPHQTRPSGRHGTSAATFGDRVFVYGGATAANAVLGDLGFYTHSSGNWTDTIAGGALPSGGRWYPQIVAQSETKLVVFGGSHAVSYYGSDDMNVYIVSLSQSFAAWSAFTPGGVGPNGFFCGWALMPPGRPDTAVWFGFGSGQGQVFWDQIWELDTIFLSWTAVPTSGPGPSGRWKTNVEVVHGNTTCPELVSFGGWSGNGIDSSFRMLPVCETSTTASAGATSTTTSAGAISTTAPAGAISTTTSADVSSTTAIASPDSLVSSSTEESGFLIYLVVGVALVLLCIFVVGLAVFVRRRKSASSSSSGDPSDPPSGDPNDRYSDYNTVDLVAQYPSHAGVYNTVDVLQAGNEYNTVDEVSAAGEYQTTDAILEAGREYN